MAGESGPCQGAHSKCALCKGGEVKVGLLGAAHKTTGAKRVRGCKDPTAVGARNRTKGKSKQRIARRAVGVGDSAVPAAFADEEAWGGVCRFEVKAGKQVGPIATRFLAALRQSEKSRSTTDTRPFAMVCMPDGWGANGLVIMDLETFQRTISCLEDS